MPAIARPFVGPGLSWTNNKTLVAKLKFLIIPEACCKHQYYNWVKPLLVDY
jgi:hypothetical protein